MTENRTPRYHRLYHYAVIPALFIVASHKQKIFLQHIPARITKQFLGILSRACFSMEKGTRHIDPSFVATNGQTSVPGHKKLSEIV